jgi:hypothetical protein
MGLSEDGCEDGRWTKMAQACAQPSFDISGVEPLHFAIVELIKLTRRHN